MKNFLIALARYVYGPLRGACSALIGCAVATLTLPSLHLAFLLIRRDEAGQRIGNGSSKTSLCSSVHQRLLQPDKRKGDARSDLDALSLITTIHQKVSSTPDPRLVPLLRYPSFSGTATGFLFSSLCCFAGISQKQSPCKALWLCGWHPTLNRYRKPLRRACRGLRRQAKGTFCSRLRRLGWGKEIVSKSGI